MSIYFVMNYMKKDEIETLLFCLEIAMFEEVESTVHSYHIQQPLHYFSLL